MALQMLQGRAGDLREMVSHALEYARAADNTVDPQDVQHLLAFLSPLLGDRLRQHIPFDVVLVDLEQANGTLNDRIHKRPRPRHTLRSELAHLRHDEPERVHSTLVTKREPPGRAGASLGVGIESAAGILGFVLRLCGILLGAIQIREELPAGRAELEAGTFRLLLGRCASLLQAVVDEPKLLLLTEIERPSAQGIRRTLPSSSSFSPAATSASHA